MEIFNNYMANILSKIFDADVCNKEPLVMGIREEITLEEIQRDYNEKGDKLYESVLSDWHNRPLYKRINS
jgi:hypothetical protein